MRKFASAAVACLFLLVPYLLRAESGLMGNWGATINIGSGWTKVVLEVTQESNDGLSGTIKAKNSDGTSGESNFIAKLEAGEYQMRFRNGSWYHLRPCADGLCGTFHWQKDGKDYPVTFVRS